MGNVNENLSTSVFSRQTFLEFTSFSLPLILSQLSVNIPDAICYVVLGSMGNADSITVYGLSWTFFNMLCFCTLISIGEIAGACCSKAFGAQNFRKMAGFFYKSLVLVTVALAVYFLFCLIADQILLLINIPAEIAARSGDFIRFSFWPNFLIGFNVLLQDFLIAQNIISPFNYLSIFNIGITLALAKPFIVTKGYNEYGVVYVKLIQEGFCFLFLVAVALFKADKRTFVFPGFRFMGEHARSFLRKNFFSFLGLYGEFLAFEVNTLIVAQFQDLNAMAAWITYANVFELVFSATVGFGNTFRTRVGVLIGEGRVLIGRKKSIAYFIYVVASAVVIAVPFFLFSSNIARLFIDNDQIVGQTSLCLQYLSVNIPAVFCIGIFFSLFRVLNMEGYMFKMAAVAFPALSLAASGVLALGLGWKLTGVVAGQVICFNGLCLIFFKKIYRDVNWEENCRHEAETDYVKID